MLKRRLAARGAENTVVYIEDEIVPTAKDAPIIEENKDDVEAPKEEPVAHEHILSYSSNKKDSKTHTSKCSLCGKRTNSKEKHTFEITGETKHCTLCGYETTVYTVKALKKETTLWVSKKATVYDIPNTKGNKVTTIAKNK